MTYEQANRILDRTREGWQFSEFVITRALELTGDYEPTRSSGVEKTLPKESVGGGQTRSVLLVARSD
jgi:hypothetical protein